MRTARAVPDMNPILLGTGRTGVITVNSGSNYQNRFRTTQAYWIMILIHQPFVVLPAVFRESEILQLSVLFKSSERPLRFYGFLLLVAAAWPCVLPPTLFSKHQPLQSDSASLRAHVTSLMPEKNEIARGAASQKLAAQSSCGVSCEYPLRIVTFPHDDHIPPGIDVQRQSPAALFEPIVLC